MNLTQNSPGGCAAVVAAGALEPVAALLAQLVRGGPKIKGEQGSKGAHGRESLPAPRRLSPGCRVMRACGAAPLASCPDPRAAAQAWRRCVTSWRCGWTS